VTREPGTPKGSIGKGFSGVAIYDSETLQECAVARFDKDGALINADEAVGELVNTDHRFLHGLLQRRRGERGTHSAGHVLVG
jgi:hypothetical protein